MGQVKPHPNLHVLHQLLQRWPPQARRLCLGNLPGAFPGASVSLEVAVAVGLAGAVRHEGEQLLELVEPRGHLRKKR